MGNSGADVEVVVLELVFELLDELLEELLVDVLLLELLDELDEDVEVEFGEYLNVTTLEATAPLPPQVALTVKVPVVQAAFPPGCEV